MPQWLPGGKTQGKEYSCGSVAGGSGDSFRVNLDTGKWAEFSGSLKGGDLISLYAAVRNLNNGEAYISLGGQTDPFDFKHPAHGQPSSTWTYRDASGQTLMIVARYETATGKQFLPWIPHGDRFKCKGLLAPRPLYGLDLLAARPDAPILIVEGEKTAEAARSIAPQFVVVTWSNGAKAWSKTDWTPIYGRKAALWPDADKPGVEAMTEIANLLATHAQIKLLDISQYTDGQDAADVNLTPEQFSAWCKDTPYYAVSAKPVPVTPIQPDISVNVAVTNDTPAPTESQYVAIERLGLAVTDSGKPICNASNVVRFLSGDSKHAGHIWFDDFYGRIITDIDVSNREWRDADTLKLMLFMQNDLGMHTLRVSHVDEAVSGYAQTNRKNEPRDWLDSLVWDKTERLHQLFMSYFGTEATPYYAAAGHNFMVGMVARVFRPGCQNDQMIVLEGPQNAGKTSALRIIGGAWYSEMSESVQNKDFLLILKGRMLLEIAELDSFSKAEVNRIKQVISCPMDRYRSPYGKNVEDHSRTCIFAGTTNDNEYLRDRTGARRFIPIRCGKINLQSLKDDRDQIFAQAVHIFKSGETWHLYPTEETSQMQAERTQTDEWDEILRAQLGMSIRTTILEASTILKLTADRLTMSDQKRIANCLRNLGFSKKVLRNGGVLQKTWVKE